MPLEHSYTRQLGDLGHHQLPQPLDNMRLALINRPLFEQLALPESWQTPNGLFADLFAPQGQLAKRAFAQKYGGHQFGQWNPQLGDGRGLLLGEWVSANQRHDLHLKGAGTTPYSRFGDGRAALRSTTREYLASEALHHLGMPSSRALALVSSSTFIQREQAEPAAMLIRVCQSHIRFGHFEYYHHSGQSEKLQQLFDYCFAYHFADCASQPNPYAAMLKQIVQSTAEMIAKWQAFGFNHGVMNTDNMSVHGITFDFGPYAFMDDFIPDLIANHSDHSGRYAFDQQAGVALWNLNALAHAFTPYLDIDEIKHLLSGYQRRLEQCYWQLMADKLALDPQNDLDLLTPWLALLAEYKWDYQQSFRQLAKLDLGAPDNWSFLADKAQKTDEKLINWLHEYATRLQQRFAKSEQWREQITSNNPLYILRNHLAQQAIAQAEKGDFSECKRLLTILERPYTEQPHAELYSQPPPDSAKQMAISCSS